MHKHFFYALIKQKKLCALQNVFFANINPIPDMSFDSQSPSWGDSFSIFFFFQVDVENPDLIAFPEFSSAVYQECILKEGQMLYIPPYHWHYVRSLALSFSVSFWWN